MRRSSPAIPSRMVFPAAFPTGFTLYQTASSNGGVAEHYANAPALAAARAGRPLPDGSVILVVNRPAAGRPAHRLCRDGGARRLGRGRPGSDSATATGISRCSTPSAPATTASTRPNASPATTPRRRTATSSRWRRYGPLRLGPGH